MDQIIRSLDHQYLIRTNEKSRHKEAKMLHSTMLAPLLHNQDLKEFLNAKGRERNFIFYEIGNLKIN